MRTLWNINRLCWNEFWDNISHCVRTWYLARSITDDMHISSSPFIFKIYIDVLTMSNCKTISRKYDNRKNRLPRNGLMLMNGWSYQSRTTSSIIQPPTGSGRLQRNIYQWIAMTMGTCINIAWDSSLKQSVIPLVTFMWLPSLVCCLRHRRRLCNHHRWFVCLPVSTSIWRVRLSSRSSVYPFLYPSVYSCACQ